MSENDPASAPGALIHEIKTTEARGRTYRFRSLTVLSYTVVSLLALNGLACAAEILALGRRWQVLQQFGDHTFQSQDTMASVARASDAAVTGTVGIALITLVLTYIVAGVWIYRAACNVRALGAKRLQDSPGWAVGWYFVPVMTWFRPFVAMTEIWKASFAPTQWLSKPTPMLLRFWWGVWVASGVIGYVSVVISRTDTTIPGLILTTQVNLVALLGTLAAIALFATIVLRIRGAQAATHANMSTVAEVFS